MEIDISRVLFDLAVRLNVVEDNAESQEAAFCECSFRIAGIVESA